MKKKLSIALLFVAGILERTHLKLNQWAVHLHLSSTSPTAQLLELIAENSEEFQKAPKSVSDSLLPDYEDLKDAVYLYFLTKQAVSLYEAQINYLPLQVYNEMRNALDHYMRAIIYPSVEDGNGRRTSHINKMTGHLQRALLDVVKLTCAAMVEKIETDHKRLGEDVLSITKDGAYIKEITQYRMYAEQKLAQAKLDEHKIGNGDESNVRVAYLEALSCHVLAYKYHQDNLGHLKWGRAKYLALKSTTLSMTILGSAVAGYIVRVLWAASENLPIIKSIIDFVKKISDSVTG